MNRISGGFRPGSDGSGAGREIESRRRVSGFYVVLVALGLAGLLGA